MAELRKPFQGVENVIRFNWHFYVFSLIGILGLMILSQFLGSAFRFLIILGCLLAILMTLLSLAVSYYVYDLAGIYELKWIDEDGKKEKIVNINAGFDETSHLLEKRFSESELIVYDFYDAKKHTEISIERARKAYPPYPETQQISTTKVPPENDSVDLVFLIFSAHEIRNEQELIDFFKELNRILKPNGKIYVVEHLRDMANFLAYNIGFFHFYSKASWQKAFQSANFRMNQETKLTPFVSNFTISKNGNSS